MWFRILDPDLWLLWMPLQFDSNDRFLPHQGNVRATKTQLLFSLTQAASVWVRNTHVDERGSEENVRDCNPIHNAFGHQVEWATEADDHLEFLSALNLFHQQSVSTLTGGCSALRIILTALCENRVSEIRRHQALITRSPRDRVHLILMGYTKLLTATWFWNLISFPSGNMEY